MGDSPEPRDDADPSDTETDAESEPTDSATAPEDESDDSSEASTGGSDADDDVSGDHDGDVSGDHDGDVSGDHDGDDGDVSSDADVSDDDNVSDDESKIDESDGEADAETDDAASAESFGTPPESSFESTEDWTAAMNDDAEPDVGDDGVENEDGDEAVPVEGKPAATDVGDESADGHGDGEPDPAVVDPVEPAGPEGPTTDEEMPLAAHIEEMVRRLAIVLGIAGVVTLVAYPLSERLIEFLWQSYVPNPDVNRPHVYGPLEFVLTKLKVAGLSGTIVGLPVFVYQTYRFMKPGLYPNERRYYLASVPTSLVLAFVGVAFSHFVILPLTVLYFTSYTEQAAIVAFGLRETFNLIVLMMGYMAVIFQIPLFVMLAIMMGLVTREWMEDKRLLFWGGFGGLAFTFVTVDPTGMAPIIIAVTMIILFEGTLALLRWTGN